MGLASKIKSSSSSSSEASSMSAPSQQRPPPSAPPFYAQQQQQNQPDFYGAPAHQPPSAYPQEYPYPQPYGSSAPPPFSQSPTRHAGGETLASSPPLGYPYAQHQDPHVQHQDPHVKHQAHGPGGFYEAQSSYAPPPGAPYQSPLQAHGPGGFHEAQSSYAPPPGAPYQSPLPPYANYPASSNMQDALAKKLQSIIQCNGLQRFYGAAQSQAVLQKVSLIDFGKIAAQWKIGKELAYDLAPLALYDIVFFCDDSGSMAFEENGERINDLKYILEKVSGIATLFDDDGIVVRFMNSNVNGDGIRSAADVEQLMLQVRFSGTTPLGTNLDRKVIQPFVLGQAMSNSSSMAKPVLAIVITDGEPYGESKDTIVHVIRRAKDALARSPYGSGALAIQIAQVGKDAKTQKFLEALDKDPIVGGMIDCTSYYEMEEEEFARKGVILTPELWLLKMCVGAIDPEYDSRDD